MKSLFDALNQTCMPESLPLLRDARRLLLQGNGHILLPGPPRERAAAALCTLDRVGSVRQEQPAVFWLAHTLGAAEAIADKLSPALAEAGWRMVPFDNATHSRMIGYLSVDQLQEKLGNPDAVAQAFSAVEVFIIDEIHAHIHTQEGAAVSYLLERVERLASISPRRLGLCNAADPGLNAWLSGGTGRTTFCPDCAPMSRRTRLSVEWAPAEDESTLNRRIESASELMETPLIQPREPAHPLIQPDPPGVNAFVQIGAPNTVREIAARLDRLSFKGMPSLSIIATDPVGNTPADKLPMSLLQTVALLQLMLEEHYAERLWQQPFPLRLLLAQTALALRTPHTPAQLAREVFHRIPLSGVTLDVYKQMLTHLYEAGLVTEENGALLATDKLQVPPPEPARPSGKVFDRVRQLLIQKGDIAYLQPAAMRALTMAREIAAKHQLTQVYAMTYRADILFTPWMSAPALNLLERALNRGWAPDLRIKKIDRTAYGLKIRMSEDVSALLYRLKDLKRHPLPLEAFMDEEDVLPGVPLPPGLMAHAYAAEHFDAQELHRWAMRAFV